MEDCTFMRIIPHGEMGHVTISSYIENPEEVRDEIQRLAYDIYIALNETPEHIFLAHNQEATDIEIHSVFGMDKKFKYDVIVHGYHDTNFLMEYLCQIGRSEFIRIRRH